MKIHLPDLLTDLLNNRKHKLPGSDAESRFLQYSVICSAGLLAMLAFGLYNYYQDNFLLCLIIFITAIGLIIGWVALFFGKGAKLVYRVNIALFCTLLFYMTFLGGVDNSLILWVNILPLIIFFLMGRVEGLIWISVSWVWLAIYFLHPFEWPGAYVYSKPFYLRFLTVFSIISVLTYFYENFRYTYRENLLKKNQLLEQQVRERQRVEQSLRESEERYKAIYLQAAEGILLVNFKGDIVECNPQMVEMLGYPSTALLGLNVFTLVHPEDLITTPPQIDKLRAGEVIFLERRMRTSTGVYLLCEQSGKRIHDDLIILLYRDVTDRKEAELALERANEALDRLAHIDGLTHIANRRKFDQMLGKEWSRMQRDEKETGVIIADVDFFKQFNDIYGHPAGDDCLKSVAAALEDTVQRPADLVARYGGEEFSILLPNTDLEGCFQIAEKMRKKIESLGIEHQGSAVHSVVTASFGVAVSSAKENLTSAQFMALADQALYLAKQKGRNRVH